jgi:hypothetical protein
MVSILVGEEDALTTFFVLIFKVLRLNASLILSEIISEYGLALGTVGMSPLPALS